MSPGPLGSSLIIDNENQLSALMSQLPPDTTLSLEFRASANGRSPAHANFHRCCDNKGPTLDLI